MGNIFSGPVKNKRIADTISIVTPQEFRNSINKLKSDGLSLTEYRALTLAKTRATLQLKRKDLSNKERREFTEISKIKIPDWRTN